MEIQTIQIISFAFVPGSNVLVRNVPGLVGEKGAVEGWSW